MGGLDADRREWDQLAREDAMWAICSEPGRRGTWTEAEFFATGEREIGGLLAGLEEHGVTVGRGQALDFGCGVGRLTRALATRFEAAVGVDISPEMIARAERLNAHVGNVRFLVNAGDDLAGLDAQTFDLVVSLIALQHVTSADVARGYVRELARVTRPAGVIAVQIPAAVAARITWHPLRALNRVVRRVPFAPARLQRALMPWSMRLVGLSEDDVRAALRSEGAEVIFSFEDRRTGSAAAPSRMYVAVRPASGG